MIPLYSPCVVHRTGYFWADRATPVRYYVANATNSAKKFYFSITI